MLQILFSYFQTILNIFYLKFLSLFFKSYFNEKIIILLIDDFNSREKFFLNFYLENQYKVILCDNNDQIKKKINLWVEINQKNSSKVIFIKNLISLMKYKSNKLHYINNSFNLKNNFIFCSGLFLNMFDNYDYYFYLNLNLTYQKNIEKLCLKKSDYIIARSLEYKHIPDIKKKPNILFTEYFDSLSKNSLKEDIIIIDERSMSLDEEKIKYICIENPKFIFYLMTKKNLINKSTLTNVNNLKIIYEGLPFDEYINLLKKAKIYLLISPFFIKVKNYIIEKHKYSFTNKINDSVKYNLLILVNKKLKFQNFILKKMRANFHSYENINDICQIIKNYNSHNDNLMINKYFFQVYNNERFKNFLYKIDVNR